MDEPLDLTRHIAKIREQGSGGAGADAARAGLTGCSAQLAGTVADRAGKFLELEFLGPTRRGQIGALEVFLVLGMAQHSGDVHERLRTAGVAPEVLHHGAQVLVGVRLPAVDTGRENLHMMEVARTLAEALAARPPRGLRPRRVRSPRVLRNSNHGYDCAKKPRSASSGPQRWGATTPVAPPSR